MLSICFRGPGCLAIARSRCIYGMVAREGRGWY
jgi:hypothetical protein